MSYTCVLSALRLRTLEGRSVHAADPSAKPRCVESARDPIDVSLVLAVCLSHVESSRETFTCCGVLKHRLAHGQGQSDRAADRRSHRSVEWGEIKIDTLIVPNGTKL